MTRRRLPSGRVSTLETNNLLFFTAAVVDDEPVYTDNDDAPVQTRLDRVGESSSPVYVAVGDIDWTCGTRFKTEVEKEPFPEVNSLELDKDVTVAAPFRYRPKTDPPVESFSIATW